MSILIWIIIIFDFPPPHYDHCPLTASTYFFSFKLLFLSLAVKLIIVVAQCEEIPDVTKINVRVSQKKRHISLENKEKMQPPTEPRDWWFSWWLNQIWHFSKTHIQLILLHFILEFVMSGIHCKQELVEESSDYRTNQRSD